MKNRKKMRVLKYLITMMCLLGIGTSLLGFAGLFYDEGIFRRKVDTPPIRDFLACQLIAMIWCILPVVFYEQDNMKRNKND